MALNALFCTKPPRIFFVCVFSVLRTGGASSAAPVFKAIPHVDGKHHNPSSVLDVKGGRGREWERCVWGGGVGRGRGKRQFVFTLKEDMK